MFALDLETRIRDKPRESEKRQRSQRTHATNGREARSSMNFIAAKVEKEKKKAN